MPSANVSSSLPLRRVVCPARQRADGEECHEGRGDAKAGNRVVRLLVSRSVFLVSDVVLVYCYVFVFFVDVLLVVGVLAWRANDST